MPHTVSSPASDIYSWGATCKHIKPRIMVLLHNGGFCNGCITNLNNCAKMRIIKKEMFFFISESYSFSYEGKVPENPNIFVTVNVSRSTVKGSG
jgi:hypothetical protein